MGSFEPYAPLNVPKPFGEEAWIVDGPEIRMDYGPASLPFPTRMVMVRLADGGMWIHSPVAPDAGLFAAVDRLGEVRHLVAPNSLHYWYMADWIARYPQARTYAVPGLREKAGRPFRIDHVLDEGSAFDWQTDIDWLLVPGTAVVEAVFLARSAYLLILTDLVENFEPSRVRNRFLRWLIQAAGANGSAPFDLRLTFMPRMRQVRRQVGRMLEWPVERMVMAHGRPCENGARTAMEEAFRWAAPKESR